MAKLVCFLLCITLSSCAVTSPQDDDKALLHMQLGLSQLEQNNLPKALSELLRAEEVAPNNPFVHNNLGLVYFLREKYDLSIKHFKKAFLINNKFTDAENNLARVYIETKQFELAEKHLLHVLEDLTYTAPNKALLNFGMLKFEQKKYTDSFKTFQKLIASDSNNCHAKIFIGRIFLETNKNKLALDTFKDAQQICSSQRIDDIDYYYAISLYRNNLKNDSLNKFKELLNKNPNSRFKPQAQKMMSYIEKGTL